MGKRTTPLYGAGHRAFCSAALLSLCIIATVPRSSQAQASHPASAAPLAEVDRLIKEGHPEQAISLLLPFAGKQPPVPGVDAKLGKAYYETRDLSSAIQHLEVAVKQNSDDWESTQLLAIADFGSGQVQRAASLLAAVTPHLTEGQADAEHLLGLCYMRLQDFEKARGSFASMFAVSPDSAMAHFLLGKMMVGQKMDDAAIPELQKALQLDQRLAMAHFILGEIDLTRGDSAEALAEFQQELIVNPSVWLVYWREGEAYMRLQRYGEAEQALKQALWLNDSFTGGYLMLGEIELQRDEPGLARGFLERAVKLDPQNEYAHFFLGRAYQKLGMAEQSRREFDRQKALRDAKNVPNAGSEQPKTEN